MSADITYRWEMSTTDCNSGFAAIDNTNSPTYDPGTLTVTTYFRRLIISTLNGVPCEDISNCVKVEVLKVDCGGFPWRGNE